MCWYPGDQLDASWCALAHCYGKRQEKQACHENVMVIREFGTLMDDSGECQQISQKKSGSSSLSGRWREMMHIVCVPNTSHSERPYTLSLFYLLCFSQERSPLEDLKSCVHKLIKDLNNSKVYWGRHWDVLSVLLFRYRQHIVPAAANAAEYTSALSPL